jgi:DNA processing protein
MAINDCQKVLIALSHFPKFGPKSLAKLTKHFPDLENAFKAPSPDLIKAGINEKIALEFIDFRKNLFPDKIMENLARENIRVTVLGDDDYPKLLKEIYDPPALLFYKGTIDDKHDFCLAIVGTRNLSSYGKLALEKIMDGLCPSQLTIISGLALGIDTLAHSLAIDQGKRTVAVLGTGVDNRSIYPRINARLAEKIVAQGGAVVSEFPPGTEPLPFNFPQRNRIISGMSLGTLVIEAGIKSGALITAKYAVEQNREVFAVPGSIMNPVSEGPNFLIKQGAISVQNANDILEALNLEQINAYIANKKMLPESKEEELILACLDSEPKHINELVRLTKLTTSVINYTLILLEMKGMARNVGDMQYVLGR